MNILQINNFEENKLIKVYQKTKDQNIALYFFDKYKNDILKIIYSKINKKFSSIPLEKGDFIHIVWNSVTKCLKQYKPTLNINFKNYIIKHAYNSSIREAIKFLSNKHIVLNTAYSYEKIIETKPNFNFGSGGQSLIDNDYSIATKRFIDNVIELNKKYDINFLKKVIYLKSIGCSNDEICRKLRKEKYVIKNVIDYICKIAKKLYE